LLFLVENKQKQILRGVYPERNAGILRFAQNDKRRAQNDIAQRFFNKLLNERLEFSIRLFNEVITQWINDSILIEWQ
ncbi:MAG TPA: hypothetical protein VGX94_02700, partial [Terriglobia bacterium]|nr:hypothetical protein [Terriglobia bacterium]